MVLVESPWFTAWRSDFLPDNAYAALEHSLLANPELGKIISGTHGLRKLRIALPGRGKRGGARVIYYYWSRESRIYLLLGYAKNVQEDLTMEQIRRLAGAMKEDLRNG